MSDVETNTSDPDSPEIGPAPAAAPLDLVVETAATIKAPRPWGPWATLGWSLLLIVVFAAIQVVSAVAFVAAVRVIKGPNADLIAAGGSGDFVALATFTSTPFVVGLTALIIVARGCSVRDYLALQWPPVRKGVLAFLAMVVIAVSSDGLSVLLGRPVVPPVMVDMFRSAWLPTLLLAVVVLAPIGEEVIFRGFFYRGIAASRWGPVTAIILSATGWALLHAQYDWYGVASIAVFGLYLGFVRYWTGSLLLTMVLHAVMNGVATLEIVVQEYWLK